MMLLSGALAEVPVRAALGGFHSPPPKAVLHGWELTLHDVDAMMQESNLLFALPPSSKPVEHALHDADAMRRNQTCFSHMSPRHRKQPTRGHQMGGLAAIAKRAEALLELQVENTGSAHFDP